MESIRLNVIPFTPVNDKLTFAFYDQKTNGSVSIKWDKLFDTFPEGRDAAQTNYYTDFQQPRENVVINKEIDLFQAIQFGKNYFRYIIHNHFKGIKGAIVFPNFTNDVEVWIEQPASSTEPYRLYNKFTLKVQYKTVTNTGYELLLAYNGTSKVWKQSIADIIDYDGNRYTKVVHNGIIYQYEGMPSEFKQDIDNIYPILNNEIKRDWEIEEERKIVNRYPIYLNHIETFYKTYLKTKPFNTVIQLSNEGFCSVPDERIFKTKEDANMLAFRDGPDYNPFNGLRVKKPLVSYTAKPVKFFFIFKTTDGKTIKNTFYEYIMNGWHKPVDGAEKHTSSMKKFINQNFSIDPERRVTFTDDQTIFEEVEPQLRLLKEDATYRWVAIYFSPISKDAKTHPQYYAYYKIKQLLLEKSITSQVVYTENLPKDDFYNFLPNISVALLAKIGGIPWRLNCPPEEEVIIGIGAFKAAKSAHRFVGSAFCFDNTGTFEGFDCFRSDETTLLAGSISNAVDLFIKKKHAARRVIIHFYKEISNKKELEPILKMLQTVTKRDIPVIVVTINKTESQELMGFDLTHGGKMPKSGRYISAGKNKYLLFNNVRYFDDSKLAEADYHFPIKLSLKASDPTILDDYAVARQLVDQVYQFSRMYWKSIRQQNLPVTTRYPEMVAQIYPHFPDSNLPDFGKKNLWFL